MTVKYTQGVLSGSFIADRATTSRYSSQLPRRRNLRLLNLLLDVETFDFTSRIRPPFIEAIYRGGGPTRSNRPNKARDNWSKRRRKLQSFERQWLAKSSLP
jgi:hypothetical protein